MGWPEADVEGESEFRRSDPSSRADRPPREMTANAALSLPNAGLGASRNIRAPGPIERSGSTPHRDTREIGKGTGRFHMLLALGNQGGHR
jgi:hypothetical protein